MRSSLTRQILVAHAATAGRSASAETGHERLLAIDHIVLDRSAAGLVLAALEAGRHRVSSVEVLLVCLDRVARHFGLDLADERPLAERARRFRAHVSHSGNGGPDPVYRERFAAPGKLALAAGRGIPSCGALGMLPARATVIETAFVLGGGPLQLPRFQVVGVRLLGGLGPSVSGHDLALEIGRRLPARLLAGAVIELCGAGVSALAMADRIATAARAPAFGAPTAVFPSDQTTRRFLRANGREADWKALQGDDGASHDIDAEIDLDAIEPLIAPVEDFAAARPVRHLMGMRVRRVVAGAEATAPDIARLAAAMDGGAVHRDVDLVIVPGSRQTYETAAQCGAIATLLRAGARVLEGGVPESRYASGTAGNVLSFGESAIPDGGRECSYVASPETCAAAASVGHLVDPRERSIGLGADLEPERYMLEESGFLRPLPEATDEQAPGAGTIPLGRPLEGALRGPVLARLGDHVRTEQILPWGARLEPLAADLPRLSEHAFAALDPDLVSRARRFGGGFLVAGRGFGAGAEREQAALVPVVLGIRAVLARSFEPSFRRQLVNAGVLPLRLKLEGDYRTIAPGDELEIPSLPEILEPGKPVEVRNLTRGTQHTLPHDLDARETAVVRAGGLLRWGVAAAVAAVGRRA